MSKAVCALDAAARWAVTGTPIQNRIGDLAALLKFIRAHPYDEAKRFESDIGQMWKTGDINEAARRLKDLSSGLILRRPKTVIDLPPRKDLKFRVDFSPDERKFYDKLRHQAIARMEEAFSDGDGGSSSDSYITVIQKINALRMVCNLGLHYDSRHDLAAKEDVVFTSWRMTLDLVAIGLDQARIRYVRFDGNVPQKQRSSVIEKFKKDPSVTVFLLTLSCGAVG
ncbi:hypothetical protein Neosp_005623 [[Neocosmospora] mangrovei]